MQFKCTKKKFLEKNISKWRTNFSGEEDFFFSKTTFSFLNSRVLIKSQKSLFGLIEKGVLI